MRKKLSHDNNNKTKLKDLERAFLWLLSSFRKSNFPTHRTDNQISLGLSILDRMWLTHRQSPFHLLFFNSKPQKNALIFLRYWELNSLKTERRSHLFVFSVAPNNAMCYLRSCFVRHIWARQLLYVCERVSLRLITVIRYVEGC